MHTRVHKYHIKHELIYDNNNNSQCLDSPTVSTLYLEKLVNLGQVNSLLGIQFVDVAAVSIHQVEAEPHHLFLKMDVHHQPLSKPFPTITEALRSSNVTYFEQHVFLAGGEVHLVLVVVHAQVDDVRQQLLVPVDHLQLLLQRLAGRKEEDH